MELGNTWVLKSSGVSFGDAEFMLALSELVLGTLPRSRGEATALLPPGVRCFDFDAKVGSCETFVVERAG
jgi:hypothetical protein